MLIVYSPRYHIDIGPHVFPTVKYVLVRQALEQIGGLPFQFVEPRPASWEQLALVHTDEYLTGLRDGTLPPEAIAQLELPWSAEMVEGFRLMCGGTVDAALAACAGDGGALVGHIGGGLHHGFPNHGEGFCPFNDVAVAARVLQTRGIDRIAIVDLDVHHGNGTAFIFAATPPPPLTERHAGKVFTFSMHQQHNYPMWKPRGSLDIGLPDGAGDDAFLRELKRALPEVIGSKPQCVFYLAGADPFEEDQLGGLRLTRDGLRQRDRLVFDAVRSAGVPLVVTLAGGYARRVEDTVAIHVATLVEAARSEPRIPIPDSRSTR